MAEYQEKPKSLVPMIATGLVMMLLFGGFALFLLSLGQNIPDVDQVAAEARVKNLADLNAQNQKILTQYHWIDKSKGVVGIPIDRAMDLVLSELQSNKPHPAGSVSPPAAPQAPAAPQPQASSPSSPAAKKGGQQ
jgi:hypothetical protein